MLSRSPTLPLSPSRDLIVLALILAVAAAFRLYGLAWDGGYLFHPDERKIILVASDLALPKNLFELVSTDSPLNPKFFAYGSFPIYLLRGLSVFAPRTNFFVPWRDNSLVDLALLGRILSTLFDLGTIIFTFLLARRLYDARIALLASACIAVTVLHIQLAHFYAVDTLLAMLVVATMYFAARFADTGSRRDLIAMSVAYGLALATKTSAVVLIAPMVVAMVRARGSEGAGAGERGSRGAFSPTLPLSHSPCQKFNHPSLVGSPNDISHTRGGVRRVRRHATVRVA